MKVVVFYIIYILTLVGVAITAMMKEFVWMTGIMILHTLVFSARFDEK